MKIQSQQRFDLRYPAEKNKKLNLLTDPSTPIYKYYPLEYLIKTLRNKQFLINKVNDWQDVYENFLFKQPLILEDGTYADWLSYTDCIYGQCWTYLKSSDAMWRIYSKLPNNQEELGRIAVRIQTTPKKLMDVFYTSDMSSVNLHLGNVNYKNDEELNAWLQNHKGIRMAELTDIMFESLCIKRMPFKHEEEFRVIIMEEHSPEHSFHPKFLAFDIDPEILFDEIVIEPRLKNEYAEKIKEQILKLAPRIAVRQSDLYHLHHQEQINLITH